jgi:hypothetical protein
MLEPLLAALPGVDRLVLLGDLIELRQGPMRDALAAAEPVLKQIGQALPKEAEVTLVPGNHDHHLLSAWLERRARGAAPKPLGLCTEVDWRQGDTVSLLAAWLSPARLRVCYPGVWLRDDVYATHGHYLDRHTTVPLFERLGAGVMARVAGEAPDGPISAEDYERVLSPIYAWLHAVAQSGGGGGSHGASARAWRALAGSQSRRGLRRRTLTAVFPLAVAVLNRAGVGPVGRDISGPELRRASLRAFSEVLRRLEVQASYVIFGHTHRAGPLGDDGPGEWQMHGHARAINTGCWVHEPGFLGPRPAKSPYRAGFAVSLPQVGAPELLNLLDAVREQDPA